MAFSACRWLATGRAHPADGSVAALAAHCRTAEVIMDLGIGDIFNCRIAGNVQNPDILGSMEFACKLAGAKVVLVMAHTACGAVKGATDNAQLGNLTGLLAKIRPAVEATTYNGERSAKNYAFVDAVARKSVEIL
jgi:carbonic anhydrase